MAITATRIGPTIVAEELNVEGAIIAGETGNFIVGDLGGGYTALTLNAQLDNGVRVGLSTSADDPELYLDTQTLFTFENNPTIFAKLTATGLAIGDFQAGSAAHRLDIGDDTGNVIAFIDDEGNVNAENFTSGTIDTSYPLQIIRPGDAYARLASSTDINFVNFLYGTPQQEWGTGTAGTGVDPFQGEPIGGYWYLYDITANLIPFKVAPGSGNAFFTGAVTVKGPLTLPGDPTQPMEAATKEYVDNNSGGGGGGMVYPGAGVPVSTGAAWGPSLAANTLARTNAANTFTAGTQTINGTLLATSLFTLGAAAGAGSRINNSDGQNLGLNCGANSTLYLNYTSGAGAKIIFGSGAGTQVGLVDTAGNATFSGVIAGASVTMTGNLSVGSFSHLNSNGALVCGANGNAQIADAGGGYTNFTFNGNNTNGNRLGLVGGPALSSLFFDAPGGGGFSFRVGGTISQVTFSANGSANFLGTITAATKSFRIPYPLVRGGDSNPTLTLNHSCLEGPEIAVYYRGEVETSDGAALVTLPEYFEALTLADQRTVLLTQMYDEDEDDPEFAMLMASQIRTGQFTVRSSTPSAKVAWEVKAVRADQPPLVVVAPYISPPTQTVDDSPAEKPEPHRRR